jgi:DNA-binding NtrC family response regulator
MKNRESAGQARILVVDRDDWCREFLSAVMKLLGFDDFRLVNSVAEALDALQECTFDLLITDLKFPDYRRLLEDARHRNPTIRFILMMQQRGSTQHPVYLEQVDIVYKPLSLDDIVRKIRYAIHQKNLRRAEEELRRLKQETFRLLV